MPSASSISAHCDSVGTDVGVEGSDPMGVTLLDGADGTLLPAALTATTVKV